MIVKVRNALFLTTLLFLTSCSPEQCPTFSIDFNIDWEYMLECIPFFSS